MTDFTSPTSRARSLMTALRELGATIPAALLDAEEESQRRAANLRDLDLEFRPADLDNAVVALINDPDDEAAMARLRACGIAHAIASAVDPGARDRWGDTAWQPLTAAVRVHRDEIHDALATVFDKAAWKLVKARQKLASVNNLDKFGEHLSTASRDEVLAYMAADEAFHTLNHCARVVLFNLGDYPTSVATDYPWAVSLDGPLAALTAMSTDPTHGRRCCSTA